MRIKAYGCIAIVLLAGCTATQVRWDATNIRKEVMVYYNDQIMDNLIRAKNNLPFVHVDIDLLTSSGSSQISGTIGGGETRTHTDSGPIGALTNISKAVTRPFTYSVSPQQSETLTITAKPALGTQALASPAPTPSPTMTVTKVTKMQTTGEGTVTPETPVTQKTTEETLTPAPTPKPVTIYKLYEDFAARYVKKKSDTPKRERMRSGHAQEMAHG
jgi:hypothetical protein